MKILCILMGLFCIGCNKEEKSVNSNNQRKIEKEYIESIPKHVKPFLEGLGEEPVLFLLDQIYTYNEKIRAKTDKMYDLKEELFSKKRILELIEFYKMPKLPKYDGNRTIMQSDLAEILENRNIKKMDFDILKGIIVSRSNLKSFPTDIHFFKKKNAIEFDQLQESEMFLNTPVLILHESFDQAWFFIVSQTYAGWIKKENVALAKEADWKYFLQKENFLVVSATQLEIGEQVIDMGVTLPYLGVSKEGYQAIVPVKGNDEYVKKKNIVVLRNQAHIGYLPYSKRNLYIQAFKYEGTPYSWGGMNGTVDCSSYVGNVFRTFGFQFPRNTGVQKNSIGEKINLEGKSNSEKLDIMKGKAPALLFQPGHVMIYLGDFDGKHYIIHASGDVSMKVKVENLNQSTRISLIDSMISIF